MSLYDTEQPLNFKVVAFVVPLTVRLDLTLTLAVGTVERVSVMLFAS